MNENKYGIECHVEGEGMGEGNSRIWYLKCNEFRIFYKPLPITVTHSETNNCYTFRNIKSTINIKHPHTPERKDKRSIYIHRKILLEV